MIVSFVTPNLDTTCPALQLQIVLQLPDFYFTDDLRIEFLVLSTNFFRKTLEICTRIIIEKYC